MIPGIVAGYPASGEAPVVDWAPITAMSFASKLVSWWDFDGNADDLRGLNDLTGTATYVAGLVGQKAEKGGLIVKSSSIDPPAMTDADGTGGICFGGWVYPVSTGAEDIEVRVGTASSGQAYRLAVRNSNQAFFIVGSGGSTAISSSVGAVSANNWSMLVGGISAAGRSMSLSVDAAATASGTATSGNVRVPDLISFGAYSTNVYGALHNDSSFLAAAPLTQAEITWLYNSGVGRGGADVPAAPDGAWTWFNESRALQLPSGRVVFGVTEGDGAVSLNWTDDGGWTTSRNVISAIGSADDHDNPAILRRSDGKLLYFQIRHNANTYNVGISDNVDDPSSFTVTDIASQLGSGPFSYANPFELTGETGSPILNFFRRGNSPGWTMYYSKSMDGGTTWAAQAALLSSGRPYLKACQNGTKRIDFAVTDGHPDENTTNSIRHFYYDDGAFYDSAGNAIGAPPFDTATDLTTVYDGTTNRAWIHDIKIGSDGHPRVVFSVFPSTSDHRYYYGRWTGSTWITSQICTAGPGLLASGPSSYYSGGVCLDGDDPNIVYASRGQGNGQWAMYKYTTSDGGSTFVEADMGFDGIRPFHVRGAGVVAVLNGRYVTYNIYMTRIGLMKL